MSNIHDDEVEVKMSAFDLFAASQETLEDAKEKKRNESGNNTQYLRLAKDGDYTVRILPLAPVIGPDNQMLPMKRKGYEYPVRELVLKIADNNNLDAKGKPKITFVNVCNTKLVFPDLENDLIDLYLRTVLEKYSDDEELCKKLNNSSFNGGLKYDSKRCMYVFDTEERGKGLQILSLSFSQYQELEERKLKLWNQLIAKNKKATCPISSPIGAYPVTITRTTEKKKTKYIFDIARDTDELTEEELQTLLDAPRLPEILYSYKRFHLEATIAFLHQVEEQYDINVMEEQVIKDCIDQIKMKLPADDQSHFTLGGKNSKQDNKKTTLDDLWAIWEELDKQGLDDRSEEGADLRTQLREFIEDNDLDVQAGRKKSNLQILEELQDLLGEDDEDAEDENEEEEAPAPKRTTRRSEPEEDEDDEPATPSASDEDEEDEDPRDSRNDDTNEPAARPRRVARPARRGSR